MNKSPNPDKVLELANIFRQLHKEYGASGGIVDMTSVCWSVAHPCKSPACHAGWWAVHKKLRNFAELAGSIHFSYEDAANSMADFLEMPSGEHLRTWAASNPKLWGNDYGQAMFASSCAFTGIDEDYEDNPLITLDDIAHHWLLVHERMRIQERAQKQETE